MRKTLFFSCFILLFCIMAAGCEDNTIGEVEIKVESIPTEELEKNNIITDEEKEELQVVDSDKPIEDDIEGSPAESEEDLETSDDDSLDTEETEIPENKEIFMDEEWEYADYTVIHNEPAILYYAKTNRKNIIIGVDAGHGTTGASGKKIYCHPDKSLKTTGGSTAAGSLQANAQSGGMTFKDGVGEGTRTLEVSKALCDKLLENGYDVLMLRDKEKIELDLLARTLIANHYADCHVSLHFDGDSLDYNKGAFYISVPDGIKNMPPVDQIWQEDDRLGKSIVDGLSEEDIKIYGDGKMGIDLMQTSYSTIPSVDIELGNQCLVVDEESIDKMVEGIIKGIDSFFGTE